MPAGYPLAERIQTTCGLRARGPNVISQRLLNSGKADEKRNGYFRKKSLFSVNKIGYTSYSACVLQTKKMLSYKRAGVFSSVNNS